MAPSQRIIGEMMKRGRKGRTARPIAADVNNSNEHVGVISCKPRQLASEVPMRKTAGLVEAPLRSPWLKALHTGDCKQLMNLLQENPCRVVQKGEVGFTVLHAGAICGCLGLLDQVFDLFKDENLRFVDEKEGIELSLQKLLEAESILTVAEKGIGAAGLTAFEFAWWSMGGCKAREYLRGGRPRESRPFLSYQSKIFGSSIHPEAVDQSSSPRALLLGVLADHGRLLFETMRSRFEEYSRYNFLADCEELRFHHACQSLGRMDCREYVEAVIGGCVEKGPHVLRYLFQLRNAEGLTPLHVALNSGSCGDLLGLINPRATIRRECRVSEYV